MDRRKLLKRIGIAVGGVLGGVVLIVLVLVVFQVRISLDGLRPGMIRAAEERLDREVSIEGGVGLVLGLPPVLELRDFRISNPKGWADGGDLVHFDKLRARVAIGELLNGRLNIHELMMEGMVLSLEKGEDGVQNWTFPMLDKPDQAPEAREFEIIGLGGVVVRELVITMKKVSGSTDFSLYFDEVKGSAAPDVPLNLDISGTIQEVPFMLSLAGEPLKELLMMERAYSFTLDGELEGLELELSGQLAGTGSGEAGAINFAFRVEDFDGLGAVAGPVPDFGRAELRGTIEGKERGYHVSALSGNLGIHDLSGQLKVDLSNDIPEIDGLLNLPVLDFGGANADPGEAKQAADEAGDKEVAAEPGPEDLKTSGGDGLPVTGRFVVSVGEVLGAPLALEEINVELTMSATSITGDLSGRVFGDEYAGKLEYDGEDEANQNWSLMLGGAASDVGPLIDAFTSVGIWGAVEELRFLMSGRGEDLRSLWAQKNYVLNAHGGGLRWGDGDGAIAFGAKNVQLVKNFGQPLRLSGQGEYREEDFSLDLVFRNREMALKRDEPSFELSGWLAGAMVEMRRRPPTEAEGAGLPYELEVSGERAGDLAGLTGISRWASLPYALSGRLSVGDGWRVNDLAGEIGATKLTGEIGMSKGGGGESRLGVVLDVEELFAVELMTLISRAPSSRVVVAQVVGQEPAGGVGAGGFDLDQALLPKGVDLGEADIDFRAGLVHFDDQEFRGVTLKAEVREGRITEAPFGYEYEGESFAGRALIDLKGTVPKMDVQLAADKVDVAKMLSEMNLAELPGFTTEELELNFALRGSTAREILRESDFRVQFGKGRWVLRDGNTRGEVSMAFDEGRLEALAGEPLQFELEGKADGDELSLRFESDSLAAFADEKEKFNAQLISELPGTTVQLDFKMDLPLDREDINGTLFIDTGKLSDLDNLLDVDLPPLSPFRLRSQFRLVPDGYSLKDIDLLVGGTRLAGTLDVKTAGARPEVDATLVSKTLQVNDFVKEGWSPRGPNEGARRQGSDSSKIIDNTHQKLAELLSPGILEALNGRISLRADDVRSGKDVLGRGSLVASVNAGRFTVDPIHLSLPGGKFQGMIFFHPTTSGEETRLEVKCQDFDYGVFARRSDPSSDASGRMNLDAKLRSAGPVGGRFSAHASGYLNFGICPERFSASGFDLWATNLVTALIPRLDPERRSKLNCVVGELVIEGGIMELVPEAFIIDATRVRARAGGTIDFKKETIDVEVVPQAKRPQMLNLNTPIRVDGTFKDFGGRVTGEGAIRSLTGAATRTVLFPLRLFTSERLPEDGSDVCPCVKGE